MEKIKKRLTAVQSIRVKFAVYVAAGLLTALGLALAVSALCSMGQDQLFYKYESLAEKGRLGVITDGQVEPETHGYFYIQPPSDFYTPREQTVNRILSVTATWGPVLCFVVCIGVTSLLFYKRELKKPLELLDGAAREIARQNLDFTICYEKKDELGRLCDSFEQMRAALVENNREMWRQVEERRQLNAAFSHDMRTPLTVLKGQSEMLVKYVPGGKMPREKIAATAGIMRGHILRLENYVESMSRIQRLEDVQAEPAPVSGKNLLALLEETGRVLCKSSSFRLDSCGIDDRELFLDKNLVMEVYENLLANAARYAASAVQVKVRAETELSITIWDDGAGFTAEQWEKAVRPFYQAAPEENAGQFGMGLYICKLLCEKCGGSLTLNKARGKDEGPAGAEITAAFKILRSR